MPKAADSNTVDVRDFIDERPFTGYQKWVIALCTLVCMIDGFDLQSVAFVAPAIAAEWGVTPGQFGYVFGAGMLGIAVGGAIGGPLADRFGRKWVLVGSCFMFGILSLLAPLTGSLGMLAVLRFFTGIGMGGAAPNVIALAAEYSPARIRSTVVVLSYVGFPLGAMVGGLIAANLIAHAGWQSIFYLGGVIPIALAVLLIVCLPESVQFLIARRADQAPVRAILGRIDPAMPMQDVRFTLEEGGTAVKGFSVLQLVRAPYLRRTLLLWTAFFMNLVAMYFLINWLPTLFERAGLSIERAIVAAVIMNVGGVLGGIAISRFMDRLGPSRVLAFTSLLGALLVAATALASGTVAALAVLVFFVGVCVVGGQLGLSALAASVYPTVLRGTGVGWAMGVGRIGSVLAPIVGGWLLLGGVAVREILLICAVGPFIASIALMFLWRSREA